MFFFAQPREKIFSVSTLTTFSKRMLLEQRSDFDSVQSVIDFLPTMPGAGTPKILENSRLQGLRSWPVPGFPAIRVYYLNTGDELRIVRVLHGKRDINSLLEEETASEEE